MLLSAVARKTMPRSTGFAPGYVQAVLLLGLKRQEAQLEGRMKAVSEIDRILKSVARGKYISAEAIEDLDDSLKGLDVNCD